MASFEPNNSWFSKLKVIKTKCRNHLMKQVKNQGYDK